jgi:MoxR-like ATPase
MEIRIEYPTPRQEEDIVLMTTAGQPPLPTAIMDRQAFIDLRRLVAAVPVSRSVVEYAVRLCGATRPHDARAAPDVKKYVEWGAGPRGSQYLVAAAKARALLMKRTTPVAEDIRAVALPVLRHRIVPNFQAVGDAVGATEIIQRVLADVKA